MNVRVLLRLSWVIGLLSVMGCLILLGLRLAATLRAAPDQQTSGGEAQPLAALGWVRSGHSVYDPAPLGTDAPAANYNYLFYAAYGIVARLWAGRDSQIPLVARLFTFGLSCACLLAIAGRLWRAAAALPTDADGRTVRALITMLTLGAYVGPFTGWWNLTARPDLAAVGCEVLGLLLFVRANRTAGVWRVLPWTVLFWVAWSLKQINLCVWFGTLLVLLLQRDWPEAFASLALFAGLSALPLWWFGSAYFTQSVRLNLDFPLSLRQLVAIASEAMLTGSYIYVPALILTALHAIAARNRSPDEPGAASPGAGRPLPGQETLMVVFAVTLLGNCLAAAKAGSSRNYYFPSFFVGHLVICSSICARWREPHQGGRWRGAQLMLASLTLLLGLTTAHLILPNRFGRIDLAENHSPVTSTMATGQAGRAGYDIFRCITAARAVLPPFSLTPALSRWEREPRWPCRVGSGRAGLAGRGEGDSLSQRERAGVRERAPLSHQRAWISPGRPKQIRLTQRQWDRGEGSLRSIYTSWR